MDSVMKHVVFRLPRLLAVIVAPVLVASALGGCAHGSRSAAGRGQPAASNYMIPPEDPKGSVYVMSLGAEKLNVEGGAPLYLHLRVAAENKQDAGAWVLDARNQVLVLPLRAEAQSDGGQRAMGPAFAEGSGGSALVTIPPGSRGNLDLYYPLPEGTDPSQVTLAWQLQRPAGVVAQQTTFERASGGGDSYGAGYAYSPVYGSRVHLQVGPGWWWGPYWGAGWGWDPWYYGYGPGWGWGWGGYWGRPYGYWGGGGSWGGGGGRYRAPPSDSGWRGGSGSSFRGGGSFGGSSVGGGGFRGGSGGGASGFRAAPSRR